MKFTYYYIAQLLLALNQVKGDEFKVTDLSYLKYNVDRLINASQNTSIIWDRLAEMTDLFGHRITGSKALEDSIDWIKYHIEMDGIKTYTQDIIADYWQRNEESLIYHCPSRGPIKLSMLGSGRSISTPNEGITAEVEVVVSQEDLKQKGVTGKLKNKIALCNFPWTDGDLIANNFFPCANLTGQYGAIAALKRAAAPFSINTPHTGTVGYAEIPSAGISIEDAQMLARILERSKKSTTSAYSHLYKKPVVTLKMGAHLYKNGAKTRNLIAEIKGREKPEEIVIISGHIDSWDVGVGAMDDGAGAFIAWEVLRQIKKLGIQPRRTIRAIFFVDEEHGGSGSTVYYEANKNNLENHVLAMESDFGNFEPYGFGFSGSKEAMTIFTAIGKQLLGHTTFGNVLGGNRILIHVPIALLKNILETNNGDADISILCSRGVPCATLTSKTDNENTLSYYTFHHNAGDRMEVLNPDQLSKNAAMTAGFIYAVADLKDPLPKTIVPESIQF